MVQTSLNPQFAPATEEPGYGQIFSVFVRRFPWFLLVLLSSTTLAGIITLSTKPTFQSTMQLLVEPNYQGKEEKDTLDTQFTDANVVIDTATQLNLMRSSGLLQQAVDQLKNEYPDLTVREMKKSLVLTQLKNKQEVVTKIFQVDYTDSDPEKTQKILAAIRKVYLEYNQEQQELRLKKGLQVIREQLRKASDEVNASEANLQRFRSKQNLINPELQAKAIEESLNNIQKERQETRSQYQEAVAKQRALQRQLNRSPQNALVSSRLSQSTRYQSLLNEIQKTELALAQERLRFTDNTPNVQHLNEQLNSQKELLQKEVKRTLGRRSSRSSNPNSIFEC